MPEDQDELERRLARGDEAALGELFERHRERLWRMVHFRLDRRLLGRVGPDDVLQEGYLAARQRLRHFRAEQGSVNAGFLWLRLVMGQTLIDVHRQHLGAQMRDAGREKSIDGMHFPQTTSASLAIHLAGSLTSPSRAAARAELSEQIEQAIGGMEAIDREILALRHFEELGNGEVAELLGIQPKAASIRYVRALRRLKDVLARLPGFGEEDADG